MAEPARIDMMSSTMSASFEAHLDRAQLLKGLGHAQSVVEKRGTIPILSNVKLEASNGMLAFTATDMDIAMTTRVPADVQAEGAITVPAHTFYDIVRKLKDGSSVSLTMDNRQLIVQSGRSRFQLPTLPVDDFPVMSEGDLPAQFTLPAAQLAKLIDKTRFAVSTEETRYYLNGIYLHAAENQEVSMLRAVATDGHRLARIELPLPAGASGMPGIIIPRKTVSELRKLLDGTENVGVSVSEHKIRFAVGDAVLLSKLIDGTFPDYERVIPTKNDKMMEVEAERIAEAVDRVSVIATEKTRGIKLGLDSGRLTLMASSTEQGTAKEELEVTYSADSFEIGFNSRYLLEMLTQIEGDVAQFMFADGTSPVLVRDSGDLAALYVVMPMRV